MSNILLHYQNDNIIPVLQINHHFGSVDNIELEGNGKLCIQTPYLDVPFEVKQYENDRKSTNIALSLTGDNKELPPFKEFLNTIDRQIIKTHTNIFGDYQQPDRYTTLMKKIDNSISPFILRIKANYSKIDGYDYLGNKINISRFNINKLLSYQKIRCIFQLSGLYYFPNNINTSSGDEISNYRSNSRFQPILHLLSIQLDKPIIKYTPNQFSFIDNNPDTNNDNQCNICLSNLNTSRGITKLKCGHSYHMECINKWFTTNRELSCPYCRDT